MNISGIDCYEKDGVAYLKLETVARGLGFTKTETKNGTEYITVRWERVFGFLDEIGFDHLRSKDGYIPENIFYRLAMRAKNETAEAFQAKIADEVIPSIRKHGAYITKETLEQMLGSPDFAIRLLTEIKNERERSEKLAKQVEAAKPKIDFYDAVSETSGTLTIEKFAKVLYDKTGITFGRNKMFKWLRDVKMLNKNNIPYQKYMNLGWFQTHEVIRNNQPHVVTSITGKGQQELTKRLMSWHAASKM